MIREDGRWRGRLTSRPLPPRDDDLDVLPDTARAGLADVWHARGASERRVADAFAIVRSALVDLGAPPELTSLAARAIDDEHRHAEICRVVASRFAGRELDPPSLLPLAVPRHEGADDALRKTLHVLGQCAMNETFASAYLESCVRLATAPLARAAVGELLSDEIDHARIGWAHLASLSERERRRVAPWLRAMVRANLRMWTDSVGRYAHTDADVYGAHGAPAKRASHLALLAAIDDLMLPGFRAFGLVLEAATASAWTGDLLDP